MIIRKTIGVDVDLTVCDISPNWMRYLKKRYPFTHSAQYNEDVKNGEVSYNLGDYFTIPPTESSLTFFNYERLYDKAGCFYDAQVTLQKLYEEGWDIIFISYCADCGTHAKSKAQMLQREFNFIAPKDFHFVQTKSKGVFAGSLDAFVDDRNSFLNQLLNAESDVQCIKMNSIYVQDEELVIDVPVAKTWYDVYDILGDR